MQASKFLVAYDGSELGNKALNAALDLLAVTPHAHADVVFVEEVAIGRTGIEALNEKRQIEDNKIYKTLEEKLSGVKQATAHFLRGQGASFVLLRFAEDNNNDLIILGNRGLSGVREMLGSVSHAIVQHALVPVLVIK